MKFASSLALLILLTVVPAAKGSPGRLTNYEVASVQVDSLAKALVLVLREYKVRELSLEVGNRSTDRFVRPRIIERLLSENFRLMTDSSAAARLRISVPIISVSYSAPIASHIFGSPDVIRRIQSSYYVDVADSGQICYAKYFSYSYADTISESQIPGLESGSYDFLHGSVDSGGLFNVLLQPILFVGSAAVIVYLFFSLRGS